MGSRLPFGDGLRAELGSPGRARRLASSPRSRVWLVELAGTAVVVKQVVGGPDAAGRHAREATALRLAARVDPPVAPRLLAVDPAERMLVLEHLDDHGPAGDWVVGYAATLARLHAATSPDDAGMLPAWAGPTVADVGAFLELAGMLGVAVPPRVPGELDRLLGRLGRAGHCLLHGDPCPGNDRHTQGGVRFVDFEQASLGSGLVELAYLRIGFPTCWCATATPRPLLRRAEAAYRAAWRTATGTEPHGDLVDACAGWLLRGDALVERAHRGAADHLARLPGRDWRWGTATARRRLAHRLGVVAHLTAGHAELRGLAALAGAMRRRMLARWPALQPLTARR